MSITPSVALTSGHWVSIPVEVRKKREREEERGNLGYKQIYGVEQKYSDLYRQQKIAKHLHRRPDFNDRILVAAPSSSSRIVATTVAAAHAAAAAAHYGGSAASRGGGGGTGAASSIAVASAAAKPIGKSKHSGSSGADGDYQLVQVRRPFLWQYAYVHIILVLTFIRPFIHTCSTRSYTLPSTISMRYWSFWVAVPLGRWPSAGKKAPTRSLPSRSSKTIHHTRGKAKSRSPSFPDCRKRMRTNSISSAPTSASHTRTIPAWSSRCWNRISTTSLSRTNFNRCPLNTSGL